MAVVCLDDRRGGRHVRLGTPPLLRHIPSSQSALPSIGGRALPVDSTRKITGAIESVRAARRGWQQLEKFGGEWAAPKGKATCGKIRVEQRGSCIKHASLDLGVWTSLARKPFHAWKHSVQPAPTTGSSKDFRHELQFLD